MSNVAISVENMGKQYRIGGPVEKYKTMRDTISASLSAPVHRVRSILRGHAPANSKNNSTIWALKDISFDVQHGEVLGIIGHNGAGKSTLLKILSRITEPTEGQAIVHGRLGALLEVGTGFHPELSGRENIFLNAAILGMPRREIERKLDEIIAFAEIDRMIDTPVKQYSSGMALRLGFSIAAHLEPEILVVDEVLAVGDVAFQRKCMGKMSQVSNEGRTVLFVSHNMAAITNLTQRSLVLSHGMTVFDGPTNDAIAYYMRTSETEELVHWQDRDLNITDGLTLERIRLVDKTDVDTSVAQTGGDLYLNIDYIADDAPNIWFTVSFLNTSGQRLFTLSNRHVNGEGFHLNGSGTVSCAIDNLQLVEGRYFLRFAVWSGAKRLYENDQAATIDVLGGNVFGTSFVAKSGHGVYIQPSRWDLVVPAVSST